MHMNHATANRSWVNLRNPCNQSLGGTAVTQVCLPPSPLQAANVPIGPVTTYEEIGDPNTSVGRHWCYVKPGGGRRRRWASVRHRDGRSNEAMAI